MKIRRFCCFLFAILVVLIPFSASAEGELNVVNTYLRNIGLPEQVIVSLSAEQKELIYETRVEGEVSFSGYQTADFWVNENGELTENNPDNNVSLCGGIIDEADLTLSVIGLNIYPSNGEMYQGVYPSFKWNTYVKVNNDSFSMSMYSGWEAIPGERNFRLHLLNSSGQSAQYVDIAPNLASETGYSFRIPSGTGSFQGWYSGTAYFAVRKTSASATSAITLHYAHDTSASTSISYGISIYAGSISVTGNQNSIYEMADNFYIDFP